MGELKTSRLSERNVVEGGLVERLYWLIKLRWIAFAGLFLTVFFVDKFVGISLKTYPLYAAAIFLGIYNLSFRVFLYFLEKKKSAAVPKINNFLTNFQISLDLIFLAILLHFSGGAENPFIFYFIFHMIIASILLSRRASFWQATFAIFLFLSIVIFEYRKILPHHCLKGFVGQSLHDNLLYVAGVSFVFITTLYIAVYMATSISRRLKKREKSLREANELLEANDRIKSEYVLRVTHDIKGHLSAIQGCIEPVTGGITGPLNEKQRDLLQRADMRTGKLMFFVKALLEVTRIKLSRQIKVEYFSFGEMVKEAVANIQSKARDKNLSVKLTIDPGVDKARGAREYIQETISNILANAVKYTPRNGRIDVNVGDKGNSIITRIEDTGIGIPKDELPKVFDEFYRASNAKGVETDGTGLGLSIAKQVIARHDGKIWVESEEGRGTTFFIVLPK
ncbi:MAG: HAMP domain-containing histidine kinase [Candidatus Omnitrophica bacterium]|nr:HAMP domain-containing histidine kinase [Candidatus Omnitrophota bacterium]